MSSPPSLGWQREHEKHCEVGHGRRGNVRKEMGKVEVRHGPSWSAEMG